MVPLRRYRKAQAITEYRELPGVDHWLIAGDHWEEVADVVLAFVQQS